MFITEEQLFEFKYQKNSQFFGKSLAQIFFEQFKGSGLDFFVAIRPFYHKFINDDICFVKFSDNSILSIEKINDDWSRINISENSHFVIDKQYELC